MNSSAGEFVDEARSEKWMERIGIGEVVKIKGEELEVVSIGKREITLKLLSAGDRFRREFDAADVEIQRQRENMLKRQK